MSSARILDSRVLVTFMVGVIVLAFHTPAFANDDELETLWGPETFVRGPGEPVTEVREFSIEEFEAPFILHLRNGTEDGDNRESSAWVYLNGALVISPSDFSQQVDEIEVEVELIDPSLLTIELASKPGAEVTIWIEGRETSFVFEVGPEGGFFEFPFGLSLDFPPGAVDENTEIGVSVFDCATVDALFAARTFISRPPQCAAAFRGLPDGLEFNMPITAWMPVRDANPTEYLIQFYVDEEIGMAFFEDTDLIHHRGIGFAEFKISHFSAAGAGFIEPGDGQYIDGSKLDACCFAKEKGDPGWKDDCCCNQKERGVESKSGAEDKFSKDGEKECQFVRNDISTCYGEDCGCMEDKMQEASDACKEWIRLTIDIEDPIRPCDELAFTSWIEKDVSDPSDPNPDWQKWVKDPFCVWEDEDPWSTDIGVEKILADSPLDPGFRGLGEMGEQVSAATIMKVQGEFLSESVYQLVDNYPPLQMVAIKPSGGTPENPKIEVLEEIQLEVSVEELCANNGDCWFLSASCDPPNCGELAWLPEDLQDDLIVDLDVDTGGVTGKCPGTATVNAAFTYCQPFIDDIDITVKPFSPIEVTAPKASDGTPAEPKIALGERLQLEATIPGFCGPNEQNGRCVDVVENQCPAGVTCSLEWTTSGDKLEVNQETGEVRGLKSGSDTQTVTATFKWCEAVLTDDIEVEVKPPERIGVRAKFGCCGWDASYCYVGAMQGNPVVPVTIEAWFETSSGKIIRDVPGGIYISIRPAGLARANVQPGEDTCTPFNTQGGDGCSGRTDSEGLLRLQLHVPDEGFRWAPFFSVRAKASFPGLVKETRIFAVTDDICFEHPHSSIIASNQGFGGQVYDKQLGTQCNASGDAELSPSPGVISGTASCSASACCGPGCSNPAIQTSQNGFWYDTILVIPENLNMLNNMRVGGGMRFLVSATSECSGTHTESGVRGDANASISSYFGDQMCRAVNPGTQSGTIEKWGTLGQPFWAFEQGGVYAICSAHPCPEDACGSGSASISGSLTWDDVVEVLAYDNTIYDYVPINYYLFSCSGEFTKGNVQAQCVE